MQASCESPCREHIVFISSITFVSRICLIECDTSSLSKRWTCWPQHRCPSFYISVPFGVPAQETLKVPGSLNIRSKVDWAVFSNWPVSYKASDGYRPGQGLFDDVTIETSWTGWGYTAGWSLLLVLTCLLLTVSKKKKVAGHKQKPSIAIGIESVSLCNCLRTFS